MIKTAYLRVYQALSAFSAEEQARWTARDEEVAEAEQRFSKRWLASSALPAGSVSGPEGAFVRTIEGDTFVCPWRTRLRMLAGLLAFRGTLAAEVADQFVPEEEAERAAQQLAEISQEYPEIRSHIVHANWHVPLRWFTAFDGSDRILVEDRSGLRIRYETTLVEAKDRLNEALEVLANAWIDDSVTDSVRELKTWIDDFPDDGLLELDYGSVAATFEEDELVDDHSAAEVWSCIDSLAQGDIMRAGRIFAGLSERWSKARSYEVSN